MDLVHLIDPEPFSSLAFPTRGERTPIPPFPSVDIVWPGISSAAGLNIFT